MRSIVQVGFLAQETTARKQLGQAVAQKFLHGQIGGGDNIGIAIFLGHVKMVNGHQSRSLPYHSNKVLECQHHIIRNKKQDCPPTCWQSFIK